MRSESEPFYIVWPQLPIIVIRRCCHVISHRMTVTCRHTKSGRGPQQSTSPMPYRNFLNQIPNFQSPYHSITWPSSHKLIIETPHGIASRCPKIQMWRLCIVWLITFVGTVWRMHINPLLHWLVCMRAIQRTSGWFGWQYQLYLFNLITS
jgi:hypothetical protein